MLLLPLGLVTGLLEQRFTHCSKTTENQYRHSDNCDRHGEKSDCDNALLPWLTAEVIDSWKGQKHSEFNIPRQRKDAVHDPADRAALEAQSSGSIARQQTLAGQSF
jgi:hypothetical protein